MVKALTNTRKGEKMKNQKVRVVIVKAPIRGRTVARDEQRDLAASEDRPETVADGNRVYIEKVQNGFIVKVGCSRFVSQSWTEVACALELYYNDPAAAERKYCR
jgi:hypothetical protein